MKKLLIIVVLIAVVLSVTKCGSDKPSKKDENAQSSRSQANVTDITDGESADIRPEFKQAMDDYENFYDDYIEFMKKYSESTNPTAMMSDYLAMLSNLTQMQKSYDEWGESDLSDDEILYYTEVNLRIAKKLSEIQ